VPLKSKNRQKTFFMVEPYMFRIPLILLVSFLSNFLALEAGAMQIQAYKPFTMGDNLFSCEVPADWKQERNLEEEKHDKTPSLLLLGPRAESSPVMIYATFYSQEGGYFDDYKDYIERNSKDSWGDTEDTYSPVRKIMLGGRQAYVFDREIKTSLNPESPSGETVQIMEKFYVLPAKDGFFLLHLYAPKSVYKKYLPVFEHLSKTFKGKK
jgi:hypothetical protein